MARQRLTIELLTNNLEDQLTRIREEEQFVLNMAAKSISAVRNVLAELRNFVVATTFETVSAEINFFKRIKPKVYSKLLYFTKLYRYESWKPAGSVDARKRYLKGELDKLDHFFLNNMEFYQYYRSNATYLDEMLFVRGHREVDFAVDAQALEIDPDFSTGYDILMAKTIANEQLANDLNVVMEELDGKVPAANSTAATGPVRKNAFAQTALKAKELYVFLKAIIDSGIVLNHNYKSFFELVCPGVTNKEEKFFAAANIAKYGDKVDMETREAVKRFLDRMKRNVDSY